MLQGGVVIFRARGPVDMRKTAIELGHCIDVADRPSAGPLNLRPFNFGGDGSNYLLGQLILQVKDVFECAVKSIRPQMGASRYIDELSGDAKAASRLAHAAFEHVSNTKLPPNLFDVDSLAFVGERRGTGDNKQRLEPGQRCDDVFHHPVGETILLGVSAQVLERQHRNRGFVR